MLATVLPTPSRTVRDSTGTNRAVIVSVINDEVIHVISGIEFTIDPEDATSYPGFDVIRQGVTLKNTINATGGVIPTAHRFFGTASNADKLGGVSATNFVPSRCSRLSKHSKF